MRKLARPVKRAEGEEHILPLINIVFLLLIFFMVAGHLSASDPFPIMPPQSATDVPPEAERILVQVGPDGSIALDGQPTSLETLAADMTTKLAEHPDMAVTLKADGAAEAAHIVELMEKLREAGLRKLTLMTISGEA